MKTGCVGTLLCLPGWVLGGKYVNALSLQKVPLDPDFLCLSGRIRKGGK